MDDANSLILYVEYQEGTKGIPKTISYVLNYKKDILYLQHKYINITIHYDKT